MHIHIGKKLGLAIAAAPLVAILLASPALAVPTPVTTTLFSPLSPTVTEGNTISLLFQVSNTSASSASQLGNGQNVTFVSGDSSDSIAFDSYNFAPNGFAGCGATLAAGTSCYYSALYDTPSGSGEVDGDFGVYSAMTEVGWRVPGFDDIFQQVFTSVTVQDPVITSSSVPEPITLSIFGAGLAGAVALRRRKSKA